MSHGLLQPLADQPHGGLVTLYDWPARPRSWLGTVWFHLRLRRFPLACCAILVLVGGFAIVSSRHTEHVRALNADLAGSRSDTERLRRTADEQTAEIGRLTRALTTATAELQILRDRSNARQAAPAVSVPVAPPRAVPVARDTPDRRPPVRSQPKTR